MQDFNIIEKLWVVIFNVQSNGVIDCDCVEVFKFLGVPFLFDVDSSKFVGWEVVN